MYVVGKLFTLFPSQILYASSPLSYAHAAFLDNLESLCPSSSSCGAEAAGARRQLEAALAGRPDRLDSSKLVSTLRAVQADYLGAASQYLLAPMAFGALLQILALLRAVSSSFSVGGSGASTTLRLLALFVIFVVVVRSAFSLFHFSPSFARSLWSQMSGFEGVGAAFAVLLVCLNDLILSPSSDDDSSSSSRDDQSRLRSAAKTERTTALASNLNPSSSSSASSSFTHLDAVFATFCLLVHAASLGSSSFVEEEHFTWYFLVNSALLFLFFRHFLSMTTAAAAGGDSASFSGAAAAEPPSADSSSLDSSSLNSSSYEISYSWEDPNGGAGLMNGVNGGVGRRVYRRGKGSVAFPNNAAEEISINASDSEWLVLCCTKK